MVNKQISNVGSIIEYGSRLFLENDLVYYHGTDNSYDEAYLLVCFILNINPLTTELDIKMELTQEQVEKILQLYKRRVDERIPVPYITNTAYFGARSFYVNESVMIPTSPFAEIILNDYRPWINSEPLHVLDLCCGSGALGITTAHEFSDSKIDLVDISNEALSVTEKNIKLHNLKNRANCFQSDLFSNISKKYDLIISNPPYVAKEHYSQLPEEFHHEPTLAFVADDNGLDLVKKILTHAEKYLYEDGYIFIEVGDYSHELEDYYPSIPFTWVSLYNGGEGIFVMSKSELTKYFGKNNYEKD